MAINKTRKGLAWGAVASLIATLFGALPAQADANIELRANSTSQVFATFVTEEFSLYSATLTSDANSNIGLLMYQIEKASSVGVVAWSATHTASALAAGNSGQTIAAASTSVVVRPTTSGVAAGVRNVLTLKLVDATTSSASVDVKVTAFIDKNQNGSYDAGSDPSAVQTVSFKKFADVSATVALEQPIVADTTVKATGSISGLNNDQLAGTLKIQLKHNATSSYSVVVAGSASSAVSALAENASISAQVYYDGASSLDGVLGTAQVLGVKVASIDTLTVSGVVGDNLAASDSNNVNVRVNSAFTLKVKSATGSTAVAAIKVKVTATVSTALSATKTVTFNGVAWTTSANLAAAELYVTTGADGTATFNVSTAGFSNADSISFQVTAQNVTPTSRFFATAQSTQWTIANDNDTYQIADGATANLGFSVTDQFDVLSKRTNQRLGFTVTNGTGFTSKLSEATVSAGKATAALAATPVTASGLIQVLPKLQAYNEDTQTWDDVSATADTVSVVVNSASPKVSTKPASSYSASISYGAAMSWSEIAGVKVSVGGAAVTITGTDVIFKSGTKTYSGTVVVNADKDGLVPTISATSRLAGSKTISFTVGSTTSTTLLNVADAAFDAGKTINWDTTNIQPGSTAVITGTLVDANGNPVQTYGATSGSIEVTYLGSKAGVAIGTIAEKTNSKGQVILNILTGATDNGTATITWTYKKNGTATADKDLISATHKVTVAEAAPAAAAAKISIGSFTGKVVVYAKGYTGKTVSYRIAGKWGKMVVTKDLQSATRKVGSGKSIKVDVYVDGSLVKTETITTK